MAVLFVNSISSLGLVRAQFSATCRRFRSGLRSAVQNPTANSKPVSHSVTPELLQLLNSCTCYSDPFSPKTICLACA